MTRRPRIALLIESSRTSGREILSGVAQYVRTRARWSIFWRERSLHDLLPAQLRAWRADALLGRLENPRLVEQVRSLRLPTVDVLGWYPLPGVPRFGNDRTAIAQLALQHLRERGLQRFAYCGFPGLQFSDERGQIFERMVIQLGHLVSVYGQEPGGDPADMAAVETSGWLRRKSVGQWLKRLAKPVGLLACNDTCAQQILSICQESDLQVPSDIAVIGVDNDEVLCELSDPPLTSIRLNNHQIGYQAAATLDRMLHGESVQSEETRLAPLGVVARRSTDTLAISDADVAEALRFIREHATQGIHVRDVVQHVCLSASTLRRRFVKLVGRSPRAELRRVQLDHAKMLLSTTSLCVHDVARLSGFQEVEWFCKTFHSCEGQTPVQYRKSPEVGERC